jgi:tetratricopeptide (TPR) repeat protein
MKFWESDAAQPVTPAAPSGATPSSQVSAVRHPIRYFTAAMSETPIATSMRRQKSVAAAEAKATTPQDQLSLDIPTGPPSPQLFISMAQLSERQGNIPQARQQFQRAFSTWPKDVELIRAAARMEDRVGQLGLAESLYNRAVSIDPQHAGALNDLGLCLARQGKLDRSVQCLEQAVHLQPDKALYRNNAATVLVELGQDQKAVAHLSAAHGPAAAHYNMGQLLASRQRTDEAIVYYQTALGIDPTMQQARDALAGFGGQYVDQMPMAAERVAPAVESPNFGPQVPVQQPAYQQNFPATARGPAYNTSSQVPQGNYYPAAGYPSSPITPVAPIYRSATAPRYLPPVQPTTPGGFVR